MPWLAATAAISGGFGLASSLMGDDGGDLPSLPPFYNDPLVNQSENSLFNFGSDVLKGILPASYQHLMDFNSPQFQSVLNMSNRDIQAAGLNTAALQGNARSGAAGAGITKAVADNTANMRYSDYMNTLTNQKALLGIGLDSQQVAGNMALTNQGQQNQYNLGGYTALLGGTVKMDELSMKGKQQTGQNIGAGIGGVIGSIPYLKSLFPGGGGAGGGSDYNTILGSLGSDNPYI